MYPYNHKRGQVIQTDANGVSTDHAFLAHYPVANAAAESNVAVMALTALGASASEVESGLTDPAVPRNVKAIASKAGITTKVTVRGLNFAGEEISEELTLNGLTAVVGSLAFKSVTSVVLPARTNAPAKQKATIAVTQGAQAAGTTVFTFTSAATGAAYDISAAFLAADDTTAEAATKLAAALNADATFAAKWVAVASGANITIESLTYEAQDATINLVVKTAGDSAITLGSITVNTVAGIAEDKVSVGVGKKFGIPYKLTASELVIVKLFDNSADTGTVTADDDELEKNVIALNGTPNGAKNIDLYILV